MVRRSAAISRKSPAPLLAVTALIGLAVASALAALVVPPELVLGGFLAAVAGLGIVWLVFERPFSGVVLYLMVQYLRPGEMIPALAPLRPAVGIVGLVALAFVLRIVVKREFTLVRHPILGVMVAFLAVVAASVPGSVWAGWSFQTFTILLRLAVGMFLIVHLTDSWSKMRRLLVVWCAINGYLGAWNNVLYYTGQKISEDTGGSSGLLGSFMGDGNDFALMLNVALPFAIVLARVDANRWVRRLMFASVLMMIVSIIATASRGGFLGLVAGALALVAVWRPSRGFYTKLAAAGALALFLVFLFAPGVWEKKFAEQFSIENNPMFSRVAELNKYDKDESAQGRFDAWKASIQMYLDNPVLGIGAGAFDTAYGTLYKPKDAIAANWRAAHSVYFQVLGELGTLGIVGLFLMIGMPVSAALRIRRNRRGDSPSDRFVFGVSSGLIASMGAFVVAAAFLSCIYYPHIYMLGMFAALMTRFERQGLPVREGDDAPAPVESLLRTGNGR